MDAENYEFVSIRDHSPQWSVRDESGKEVAIVTERYLSEPPYCVRLMDQDGNEGPEQTCTDRDGVMAILDSRTRASATA